MNDRSEMPAAENPDLAPDYEDLPASIRTLVRQATRLQGAWVGNGCLVLQQIYDELLEAVYEVWADEQTENFAIRPLDPRHVR